jgi:hypothetical protein
MEPKRDRTHPDTAHDDEDSDKESSDGWDLADYPSWDYTHSNFQTQELEVLPQSLEEGTCVDNDPFFTINIAFSQ